MDRLDEIEARAGAATPGPWEYDEMRSAVQAEHDPEGSCEPAYDVFDNATGDFIAHSREDVPWLTSEVRRLRAENIGLRLEFDRLSRMTQIDFTRWRDTVDQARAALGKEREDG